jgi:hypothetical protein
VGIVHHAMRNVLCLEDRIEMNMNLAALWGHVLAIGL